MNKEQLFEEIDEIYSEWHGGELHIGKERTERIKEVLNQAINFIPCCETLNDEEEMTFAKWLDKWKWKQIGNSYVFKRGESYTDVESLMISYKKEYDI